MDIERYREAVRKKVCQKCLDLDEHGYCSLTDERECGVLLHLEMIVDVVHTAHSDKLEDYIRLLRERVCSNCKNQSPDGTCRLRSQTDCGLDRFFELIVEAIEEVDAKS